MRSGCIGHRDAIFQCNFDEMMREPPLREEIGEATDEDRPTSQLSEQLLGSISAESNTRRPVFQQTTDIGEIQPAALAEEEDRFKTDANDKDQWDRNDKNEGQKLSPHSKGSPIGICTKLGLFANKFKAKSGFSSRTIAIKSHVKQISEASETFEKKVPELSKRELDKQEAEQLSCWERHLLYPPCSNYPYPKEEWPALLNGQKIAAFTGHKDVQNKDAHMQTGVLQTSGKKKRKQPDSQHNSNSSHMDGSSFSLDSTRDLSTYFYPDRPPVFDSFGACRNTLYYKELKGEIDETDVRDLMQPILFKSSAQQVQVNENGPESSMNHTRWMAQISADDYSMIQAPFDREAMNSALKNNEVFLCEIKNKRQKTQDEKEEPAGFRGTKFYKVIKRVIRLLLSKNS